jgi:superfamily II DNA or RNA helicase
MDLNNINSSETEDNRLRGYQIDAKKRVYGEWAAGQRSVMLQMPTGTGKSLVMSSIIRDVDRYLTSVPEGRNRRILLVAHRMEILEQMAKHVTENGFTPSFIVGNDVTDRYMAPQERVQLASIDTLMQAETGNWLETLRPPALVLIDEAHHASAETYKKLWERFPTAKFLGVTATPSRLGGEKLSDLFDSLIVSDSIPWFIEHGYLSSVKVLTRKPPAVLSDIRMVGGDYDIGQLDEKYGANKQVLADLFRAYKEHCDGQQGIIYAVNIAHGERIRDKFLSEGVERIEFIHGKTPRHVRDSVIENFRQRRIDIIVNVNLFTEGFDAPEMDFVQIARPTKSRTLYLQMVGRALRVTDPPRVKKILDNAGLYTSLGAFYQEWPWESYFNGLDPDVVEINHGGGEAPRNFVDVVEIGEDLVVVDADLFQYQEPIVPTTIAEWLNATLADFLTPEVKNQFQYAIENWGYTEDQAISGLSSMSELFRNSHSLFKQYGELRKRYYELLEEITHHQKDLGNFQKVVRGEAPNEMTLRVFFLSILKSEQAKNTFKNLTKDPEMNLIENQTGVFTYMRQHHTSEFDRNIRKYYECLDKLSPSYSHDLDTRLRDKVDAAKKTLNVIEGSLRSKYEQRFGPHS